MKYKLPKQVKDWETIGPIRRFASFECCDCGLTHNFRFRIVNRNSVEITIWRNEELTDRNRKDK